MQPINIEAKIKAARCFSAAREFARDERVATGVESRIFDVAIIVDT
jgi:hypothetical protein